MVHIKERANISNTSVINNQAQMPGGDDDDLIDDELLDSQHYLHTDNYDPELEK